MKPEIVLCADVESVKNPELIGLAGENLLSQPWLRLFCSAAEARQYLRQADAVREVWVASSEDVDPINLAAALKKDVFEREVYLLAFDGGGSLKSKANAAGIDAALSQSDFVSRYTHRKARANEQSEAPKDGGSENQAKRAAAASGASAELTVPEVVRVQAEGMPATLVPRSTEDSRAQQPALASRASLSRSDPRTETAKLPAKKTACLITVVSASGGSGKSTVAALSAYFAQGLGHQTLLLDADMQFGDMQYLTGVEDPITLDDVASDMAKLDRVKADGVRPALLAAPRRLERCETVGGALSRIVDSVGSRFDVVIANTSSYWGEPLAQLLERSSHVLLLVDQRASSLRASKHALEMCSRCGIATTPFILVVNRCSKNALFSSFDAACSLGGSQAVELKDGGKEVDELLGAGLPLDLIGSRNDLCLSLERVLLDLLPSGSGLVADRAPDISVRAKRFSFGKRRRRAACL